MDEYIKTLKYSPKGPEKLKLPSSSNISLLPEAFILERVKYQYGLVR